MTAATMRTHYDPATDRWLVESWLVLTPGQIDAARRHVLRVQRQRWAHMPDGDRRDEVARSVAALERGAIVRRAIPRTLEREATVFSSTPGTGRIIIGA